MHAVVSDLVSINRLQICRNQLLIITVKFRFTDIKRGNFRICLFLGGSAHGIPVVLVREKHLLNSE